MTKYTKCTVCGYVIAIPNDKSSDDNYIFQTEE